MRKAECFSGSIGASDRQQRRKRRLITLIFAVQFTARAKPSRHKQIAEWMGVKVSGTTADTAGNALREGFIEFMRRS